MTDPELLLELVEGALSTVLLADVLLVTTFVSLEGVLTDLCTVLRVEVLFTLWAGAFRSTCRVLFTVLSLGILLTFFVVFVLAVPAVLSRSVLLCIFLSA